VRGLLLLLVACGHPSPPSDKPVPKVADAGVAMLDAGPLDQDLNRLAERSAVLWDDILAVFSSNGEDCAAATSKLEAIATKHAEVIAANAKVFHEGRQAQLKIALRRFDERFNKAAQTVMQSKTIAACYENPAFRSALDQIAAPSANG
jgi:hypothetical protein